MHLYSVDACLGVEAPGQASFGEGAGQVWLDNTQCTGSEEEILDCSTSTSGVNSCTHAQDAGVRCGNVPTQRSLLGRAKFHIEGKFSSSVWQDFVEPHRTNPFMVLIVVCILLLSGCREGNVRLIGGSTAREGRVEFCLNSMWGTVCGNGWDRVDASIVCRQLGFSSAGNPTFFKQCGIAIASCVCNNLGVHAFVLPQLQNHLYIPQQSFENAEKSISVGTAECLKGPCWAASLPQFEQEES